MSRAAIESEIARLEAATPSRFASFNEDRAARLADLRAQLAALPAEVEPFPAEVEAQIARFDASTPANRRRARWA